MSLALLIFIENPSRMLKNRKFCNDVTRDAS
jgi:hypothetical protein